SCKYKIQSPRASSTFRYPCLVSHFYRFPRRVAYFSVNKNRVPSSVFAGSTGDNLKIAKPNEFDLVFKLETPFYKDIVVSKCPRIPGNVLLNLTRVLEKLKEDPREDYRAIYEFLMNLVDKNNYLVVDKLRSFLQSRFSRALNRIGYRIEVDGQESQLRYKTCGPAHTIFVDEQYSVDFVPSIRLGFEQNVLSRDLQGYHACANLSYWDAIPKPFKSPLQHPPPQLSFRSSFYAAEKAILAGKHKNCTDAIKFMKNYRDLRTNLSHLKSYYIKTLFLWKIRSSPDSYWHEHPLKDILKEMFEELTECLRKRQLPFFWDAELNMLDVLTEDQITELYVCLRATSEKPLSVGRCSLGQTSTRLHYGVRQNKRMPYYFFKRSKGASLHLCHSFLRGHAHL
ncbi:uncharacterized protein Dana_GF11519, partial [Drosophila ananassae]